VLRPRLLLSRALVEALEPDELEAVVEHERAHAAARENLRQWLLLASPDPLFLLAAGRRLRAEYEQAAELAADRAACARVAPLRLARALLKTARLAKSAPALELAAASLHREGCVAVRVRALLGVHDGQAAARATRVSPLLLLGIALLLAATLGFGLGRVHAVLEAAVHLLA
jgi:beta-lactamase regulating signal transducer with metallopeptidase domain